MVEVGIPHIGGAPRGGGGRPPTGVTRRQCRCKANIDSHTVSSSIVSVFVLDAASRALLWFCRLNKLELAGFYVGILLRSGAIPLYFLPFNPTENLKCSAPCTPHKESLLRSCCKSHFCLWTAMPVGNPANRHACFHSPQLPSYAHTQNISK